MYFQNKMTPRNAVYSSQLQQTQLQTPGTTAFNHDEVLHNENHTTTQLPHRFVKHNGSDIRQLQLSRSKITLTGQCLQLDA